MPKCMHLVPGMTNLVTKKSKVKITKAKMLELKEKTMLMAFFILLAILINIIGNIIFIPIIGILATAYTAATSAIVYCLLTATFSVNSLIKLKYNGDLY